jgi:hypothetical protein
VSNVNPHEVAASSKSDRQSDLDKFFSVESGDNDDEHHRPVLVRFLTLMASC